MRRTPRSASASCAPLQVDSQHPLLPFVWRRCLQALDALGQDCSSSPPFNRPAEQAARDLAHAGRSVVFDSLLHASLLQELSVLLRSWHLESFLACEQCLLRSLPLAFALAWVCHALPSTWPPLGSIKLLFLRPVGMHGAGVLAGRRRLVRVSGVRPTAHRALRRQCGCMLHHWASDSGRASCLEGSLVRCFCPVLALPSEVGVAWCLQKYRSFVHGWTA